MATNCPVVTAQFTDVRYLGSGCFGDVYRGKDRSTGQQRALKVLPPCQASKNEMRALYGLPDHPHIVSYYRQFTMSTGQFCLVMEYCSGGNLNDFLLSHRPNPSRELGFMKEIASAVAFLHGNGVVHRDLKPDNILLTAKGSLKVADFGLAKIASSFQPHAGSLYDYYMTSGKGHMFFLAPEVMDGHSTEKSDVFQMGVIFACILERKEITIQGKRTLATFIKAHGGSPTGIGRALRDGWVSEYQLSRNTRFSPKLHKLVKDMLTKDFHSRPAASRVEDRFQTETGWLAAEESGSTVDAIAAGIGFGTAVIGVAAVALAVLGNKN